MKYKYLVLDTAKVYGSTSDKEQAECMAANIEGAHVQPVELFQGDD